MIAWLRGMQLQGFMLVSLVLLDTINQSDFRFNDIRFKGTSISCVLCHSSFILYYSVFMT